MSANNSESSTQIIRRLLTVGFELARALRAERPEPPVLYVSRVGLPRLR